MISIQRFAFVSLFLFLLCGCVNTSKKYDDESGTPIELKYAKFLRMSEDNEGVIATIINPWDSTSVLQTIRIERPKKNAVIMALPHCGLLDSLGCAALYTNMSDDVVPNVERIANLNADVILVSPFENCGGFGGIETLGIDIVQCADYMESTPLGRAEWMRFFGRLFGHGEKADSLFNSIEQNYLQLSQQKYAENPTVAFDLITGSTWYVPGGDSYIANLVYDAGGKYIFADRKTSGSLPLAPENVFDKSLDADKWIIRYSQETEMTLMQLSQESPHYSRMNSFQTGNVYGCNLSKVHYFEETPFHPDLLLRDFIGILHSTESTSIESLRYFKKLN